jgi:hypothetical protein
MKYATKMMLVPAGRAEPEIETMSGLDKDMSNVLRNNKLTADEKISLYHQILLKNLAVESRLKQKSFTRLDNKEKMSNINKSKTLNLTQVGDSSKQTGDIDNEAEISNVASLNSDPDMETSFVKEEEIVTPPTLKLKPLSSSKKKKIKHMFNINEEIKKSNVERDSCKMKANKNNSAWAPYDMRDRKPPIYNRYPSKAFIVNERQEVEKYKKCPTTDMK